jgi:hypothetical protein
MKWIGQHIYDLVARFRNDVYLEDLSTTTETNVLVVDSDGKVSKTTVITGDVTGITEGDNITVTDPTGPVPTVALSTNVDVAGTLDVTSLGTFDASVTVAGNVGIGTAAPGGLLALSGSVSDTALLGATAGATSNALFNLAPSSDNIVRYGLRLSATNNDLNLDYRKSTDGSPNTAMTIQRSSGNVGIGTASPQTALQVGDTTGDNFITLSGGSTGAEYGINWSFNNPTTSKYSSIKMNYNDRTTKGLEFNTQSAYRFSFNTQNSAGVYGGNLMTIKGDGKVGIGTASPSARLHIAGVNGEAFRWSYIPTVYGRLICGTAGARIDVTGANSGYGLSFSMDDSAKMIILPSGDVGIGTTNPGTKLHVLNTSVGVKSLYATAIIEDTDSQLDLTSSSVGTWGSSLNFIEGNGATNTNVWSIARTTSGGGNNLRFNFGTNNQHDNDTKMVIESGGNVGIGTAAPVNKLEIQNTTSVAGGISKGEYPLQLTNTGTGNTGVTGIAFSSQSDDTDIKSAIVFKGSTNGYNRGDIQFLMNSASNNTNVAVDTSAVLTIKDSGKVGIGTTSPDEKLHVLSSTNTVARFETSLTSDMAIELKNSQGSMFFGLGGGEEFAIGTDADLNGPNSKFVVKPSGNVGIGTTSPVEKLDVKDGFIQVSGTGPSGYGYLLNRAGQDIYSIRHLDSGLTISNETDSRKEMTFNGTGNVGIGITTPKNKLDIAGSLGRGIPVTKTANFGVAATENWLIMNGTATITITLPTASSWTGRELMIKNIAAYTVISASSNVKPIDTDTAATAILPATAGSWCTLVSDGTNWVTMMN